MGEQIMDVDLDFKTQFYNLQGIHINERKKNFYKLLKFTSPDIDEDQIDIQPRNYQEKIFYVDVLIHFKKVEKLIDILKGGIGVLSSKVLKQRWFFQEAFKNMSAEELVNNFLPTLSYSLRMKVLKKLSLTLSEETMDKVFDLILERYGLFIAKQFLFSCSPEKIVHVLRNNEVTLPSEQLKRLLRKDFDLLKIYFEEYKKSKRKDFDDHDFLNYLAWKHPNLYFELDLNTKSLIKLGRHTTRAVIKTNKDNVLEDIKNGRLNRTALVREIKDFDKKYLLLFFPDDFKDINDYTYSSSLVSLVCKYPLKKRWEVFSHAFKQVYNKEIVEHLDIFEEQLAMFFPEKIQQKWAEIKYLDSDNLKYLKYYDPKKAFTFLKDKINVTSDINQRGSLLNESITVCYKNKDYITYEELLQYICKRHRNDDKNVRAGMISHINGNIDYNLITDVHWTYINEIVDIQRVRGEYLPFEIIAEYLLFVYKKKLPLEGPVTQYAKDCLQFNKSFRLWYELKEPEAEKTILEYIVKILPTIEHENRKQITYEIMSNIVDFNKAIKNDKIFNKQFKQFCIDLNDCALVMELIKQVCTKQEPYDDKDYNVINSLVSYNCLYSKIPLKVIEENGFLGIIKTMSSHEDNGNMVYYSLLDVIKKTERNNFENTLLDYFFNNMNNDCFLKQDAIKHFSAKEPEVIAKYFEKILPLAVTSDYTLLDYGFIKKYSHLGLDEKVIAHFKALVSVSSKSDKKTSLINALSIVMNTSDFLDLVKDYKPDAKKLDLANTEQKEKYQVQCDIAKAFKNLEENSILAPVLMHYCQGDYLQSSLEALYKVLYRINEEKSFFYINILGLRAMSTRKHAVFLGFELLPVKEAMTLYSVLSNKETNISAKKHLFSAVLKFFLKNPLESLLDIVFLNMDFVDKNDTEMIGTLVGSVNKIPNKYRPLFIEKVWNFLNILEQQEVKVIGYRSTLLNTITDYGMNFVLSLNKNFCETVIKKYFLLNNDKLQKISGALDNFVINYLLAYLDEPHFKFIFDIIKRYKDLYWESNKKDTKTYLFIFFTHAYEKFDENDLKFLKFFTLFWQHLFNHEDSFSEYTMLRLMQLYKENINIETFSKEVDKFFQELTAEHGPYISELLINAIKDFYCNIPTQHNTDFNLGNFACYLLESNSSDLNCFIAFNIIQNFTSRNHKNIYSKLINALRGVDSFTSRVYCNVLLKQN